MSSPAQSASRALFAELYRNSGAARYGVAEEHWTEILHAVCAKYLDANASAEERVRFLRGLRLEELALARACAAGDEKAWEVFLTRYRARLYDMAGAIAREDSVARELADSLYADLYGLGNREGSRVSKLNYYMGRGSLEGWLRTVLAQEYVNRYRSHKRLVSLDEQEEEGTQFAADNPEPVAGVDPRVEAAADDALAALAAEDRVILAAYFLDGRTLADIARMLRVHESTISRKVDKLTRGLRETIIKRLQARGLERRQAEEAMDLDVRDLRLNIRARLTQDTGEAAFNKKGEPT